LADSPSQGDCWGILVGFNDRKFDVLAWMNGDFCVSAMIKNCSDSFIWRLIVVYGFPYEDGKLSFIQELDSFLCN
jgi:hypothetical protein